MGHSFGKLLQHFIPSMFPYEASIIFWSHAVLSSKTWPYVKIYHPEPYIRYKTEGESQAGFVLHFNISRSTHTQTHTHIYISIGITAVWERSGGFLQSCWLILVWNGEQTFALRGFNSSAHLLPPTPVAIGAAMIGKFIRFLLITHGIWTESGEEKTSEPRGCRIALPVITRLSLRMMRVLLKLSGWFDFIINHIHLDEHSLVRGVNQRLPDQYNLLNFDKMLVVQTTFYTKNTSTNYYQKAAEWGSIMIPNLFPFVNLV